MDSPESTRLLLVDDDASYLELLTTHLERSDADIDITTTTDPKRALELFDVRDFDCIVSDYEMPGWSGLDLLGAVRDRAPRLPFVLLTGAGNERVASDAIDAEVTMYFRKHTTDTGAMTDRLVDSIEEAVRAYHREAALEEQLTFVDSVLGALDDVIYVIAPDGTPLYWSEAFREVTGYGDVDLSELTAYDIVPPEHHDALEAAIAAVLDGESVTVQIPLSPREGDPIPFELSGAPLYGDDGSVVGIAGIGRDLTERQRYETALEGLQRTTTRLLDAEDREAVTDAVTEAAAYVVPASHSVVYRYDADDEALVPAEQRPELDTSPQEFRYGVDEDAPVVRVYRTGDPERHDADDIDDVRDRGPVDGVFYFPLGDHGVLALGPPAEGETADRVWTLGEILATNATAALDRIERTAALRDRERVLATLHDRSAELASATSPAEVAETIVDAAASVIDAPWFAVYSWDDAASCLRPSAVAGDPDATVVDAGDGSRLVWEAFVADGVIVADDLGSDPERAPWDGARSAVAYALGDHGVFVAAAPTTDAFDDRDLAFADLLVTNATSALERATREARLREAETELRERNTELQQINRLNRVIRDITDALVQAKSRSGVTHAVCENLVTDDRYALAWIGTFEDGLTVESWAGEGGSFLDHVLDRAEEHPLAAADDESDDPVVVDDVLRDPSFADLRREAMDRGFRSAVRLPLSYNDRKYGFLELYAKVPNAFTDEEYDVLVELAAHIGNALDAVERTETLLSDRSLELRYSLDADAGPLFSLAQRAGCALDVESVTPHDEGWFVYATAESDPEPVLAAAERSVAVSEANVVRSTDGSTLFAFVLSNSAVVEAFADRGATIRHIHATPDGGSVTVAVGSSTDVRAFSDAVGERLPSADLSRRSVTADEAGNALQSDFEEVLTERQLQVLRAAYANGYFQWPRENTGETVADELDIAGPTFHQHLRKALERLLRDAFGPRSS